MNYGDSNRSLRRQLMGMRDEAVSMRLAHALRLARSVSPDQFAATLMQHLPTAQKWEEVYIDFDLCTDAELRLLGELGGADVHRE